MGPRQSRLLLAPAVLVSSLLAGCSGSPDGTAESAKWSPPAWFATQAQALEELRVGLQSCMDDEGWNVTIDDRGGIVDMIPRDQMDAISAALDECYDTAGYDVSASAIKTLTRDDYISWYQANLDTRDCLVAQGYDISEPPSQDAWVDKMLADTERSSTTGDVSHVPSWDPYDDTFYSQPEAERNRLTKLCPEWAGLPDKKAP